VRFFLKKFSISNCQFSELSHFQISIFSIYNRIFAEFLTQLQYKQQQHEPNEIYFCYWRCDFFFRERYNRSVFSKTVTSTRVQNDDPKFDPYLNVDPGTLNPYEHGECYVTDDGAETDLDLGTTNVS
jgi:hypothetical protein